MSTILKYVFKGMVYGAIAMIIAYILEMGCNILTCNFEELYGLSHPGNNIIFTIIIFVGAGAVIGFFYGLHKADEVARIRQEMELESLQAQKEERARQILKQAEDVLKSCENNYYSISSSANIKYRTASQFDRIIREFAKTVELKAKIDYYAGIDNKGDCK